MYAYLLDSNLNEEMTHDKLLEYFSTNEFCLIICIRLFLISN